MNDEVASVAEDRKKGRGGVVVASVFAAAFIVFVAQNTTDTGVTWLFFDASGPPVDSDHRGRGRRRAAE